MSFLPTKMISYRISNFPFQMFYLLFHFSLFSNESLIPSMCPADEVYAQKLKGKALSEELDLALNDMTTL